MGYCNWYILDGRRPVPTTDARLIEAWLRNGDCRRVALTEGDGWCVLTVFLCLDHGFSPFGSPEDHVPILFQTMLSGADDSWERLGRRVPEWYERYATYEEAEAGHEEMVRRVREWLANPEPLVRRLIHVKKR